MHFAHLGYEQKVIQPACYFMPVKVPLEVTFLLPDSDSPRSLPFVPDDVFSVEGSGKSKPSKKLSIDGSKRDNKLEELIVEPLPKEGQEEATEEVPMFAVAYKFKESVSKATLEEHVQSHREYCQKFSSLLYDETMETVNGRGTVSLWVGTPNDDGTSLRSEIDRFVEEDPLLKEGVVAKWDIIDLQASDKPLSPALEKEAAELERQRNDELERLYHEHQSSSATTA